MIKILVLIIIKKRFNTKLPFCRRLSAVCFPNHCAISFNFLVHITKRFVRGASRRTKITSYFKVDKILPDVSNNKQQDVRRCLSNKRHIWESCCWLRKFMKPVKFQLSTWVQLSSVNDCKLRWIYSVHGLCTTDICVLMLVVHPLWHVYQMREYFLKILFTLLHIMKNKYVSSKVVQKNPFTLECIIQVFSNLDSTLKQGGYILITTP